MAFLKGQVLVETEPISYELQNIKYNLLRQRVVRKQKILATTILRNPGATETKVDSALAYDSEYSSYWGQGKAILKGLTTVIRNMNGSILTEIKWGLEEKEERNDVYR